MLEWLKMNVDIASSETYYDEQLSATLTVAESRIRDAGASDLDSTDTDDMYLIVQYATWLWKTRGKLGTDSTVPRGLQWALHNRICKAKMTEG